MTTADESNKDTPVLSEREKLIAERAAKIATKLMTEAFYSEIGKTIVNRLFIIVGMMAVAFALGKGWIDPSKLFGK